VGSIWGKWKDRPLMGSLSQAGLKNREVLDMVQNRLSTHYSLIYTGRDSPYDPFTFQQ
jgi:hypothetical protein